jgi:hypothetical protein
MNEVKRGQCSVCENKKMHQKMLTMHELCLQ